MAWWDGSEILGGRDAVAGGTWLACSRTGRVAFITNVLELHPFPEAKSRGELPVLFLEVTLFILKPFIGPLHLLVFQELAQKTQCCTVLSLDFIVKNNLHSRVVSNIGNIELTVGLL